MQILVISGVSGSGKTTVGSLLAQDLGWVYLYGSPEQIQTRLRQRQHPFMNPSLLTSQLAAPEAPQDPATLQLEISATSQALAQRIRQHYRL